MIWDWKNLRCLFRFRPHKKYVKCLVELNNEYLLTGSEDNTIGIWEKSDFEQYKNISYLKFSEMQFLLTHMPCLINANILNSYLLDHKSVNHSSLEALVPFVTINGTSL